jgi:glycosyltransferase involved in cell wall biosynthesis
MTAEVTVVIPTHNRKDSLVQAIASARTQGSHVEIVVVDNGSTDNTPEVCKTLNEVKYIRRDENRGPSAARNAGIAASNAKYVAFLDDDDRLLPGALERLRQVLDDNPSFAIAYGQIYLGDQNCAATCEKFPAQLYQGDIFWQLLESNFIMIHSALVRRECLEQAGAFDIALWHNEDWDLWVRIAERWPVAALNKPVGVVRLNSLDQLSQRRMAMYQAASRLRQRWLNLPRARNLSQEDRRRLERDLRKRSANHLMSEAVDQMKTGHLFRFAEYALGSLRIDAAAGTGRLLCRQSNPLKMPSSTHAADGNESLHVDK